MIDLTNCIAIGTIIKTHGVRGQIVLRLNHYEVKDIHTMELVFIIIDGLPVPFFISSFDIKDMHQLILTLEDVENEGDAEELADSIVFIPAKNIHLKDLLTGNPYELIGYEVFDTILGKLGILAEITNTDTNPLLRVTDKKKEILIPVQPAFIHEIDELKKVIHVQIPAELIDLN
jgi:16S rRNA processing protein RimM